MRFLRRYVLFVHGLSTEYSVVHYGILHFLPHMDILFGFLICDVEE